MRVVKGDKRKTSMVSTNITLSSNMGTYTTIIKSKASTISKTRKIAKAVDKRQNNITNKIFLLSTDFFSRYFMTLESHELSDLFDLAKGMQNTLYMSLRCSFLKTLRFSNIFLEKSRSIFSDEYTVKKMNL